MARGKCKILLAAFVIDTLKQHRVQQLEARLKAGGTWEDSDLVFTDLSGGYFNPRYLEKLFKKIAAQASLPPKMTFHNLRHSAVTLLLSMGVPLKVIQEILGHTNFAIIANIYTDVLPSMQKEAMEKWDEAFKSDEQDSEQV